MYRGSVVLLLDKCTPCLIVQLSLLVQTKITMTVARKVNDDIREQAAFFSALSDPTRLRLFKLLCRESAPDALCVNALAALLGVTQSVVSQHLRVLRSVGLAKGERPGHHIHYFVNQEALKQYQSLLSAVLTI